MCKALYFCVTHHCHFEDSRCHIEGQCSVECRDPLEQYKSFGVADVQFLTTNREGGTSLTWRLNHFVLALKQTA